MYHGIKGGNSYMNQKKTGAFIAAIRKEKGYTQRELANKLDLSEKTISKWECGNGLPEVAIMLPLCQLLGITVNELLTGERIPVLDWLKRMEDTMMDLVKEIELEQLKNRIYKLYGLEIDSAQIPDHGAGSITYIINCHNKKYVVKYSSENGMNHPEIEPDLCKYLIQQGIPACQFVANQQGQMISTDEKGRRFHVQRFIPGEIYEYNQAPDWLMSQSAQMLGKIHKSLEQYPVLPGGIGKEFFQYRTPQGTIASYENTKKRAKETGDLQVVEEIDSNIKILEHFPKYEFDLSKLTCRNTHGDFNITQLLCGEDSIDGVIDWTTGCVHPVVWEIMRSYVYASPLCAEGTIDIDDFMDYVKNYMKYGTLTEYDLENMGRVFYYSIAVSDFYGQYYDSMTRNRNIFLQQARFSSKLMKWFDENVEKLGEALLQLKF